MSAQSGSPQGGLESLTGFISEIDTTQLLEMGLNVGGAIVVLIVGWIIAGWAAGAVRKAVDKSRRMDSTLKPLFGSLVKIVIMIVTLLTVLAMFGVPTASFIAVLGTAGLAIGLALQGTLSNVAAGVMLLSLRPFKVGDYVDAGSGSGTVQQIGLFTTELLTPDNIFISMPNSSVWGGKIVNYTKMPTRRFNLTIGIDYSDDVDKARTVLLELMERDERILKEPEPTVGLLAFGASSIDLFVRGFTKTGDYWGTVFDLQREIKVTFDARGLSFPFPQRTVTIRTEEGLESDPSEAIKAAGGA